MISDECLRSNKESLETKPQNTLLNLKKKSIILKYLIWWFKKNDRTKPDSNIMEKVNE